MMKNFVKLMVLTLVMAPVLCLGGCNKRPCYNSESTEHHHQKHQKMHQESGGK